MGVFCWNVAALLHVNRGGSGKYGVEVVFLQVGLVGGDETNEAEPNNTACTNMDSHMDGRQKENHNVRVSHIVVQISMFSTNLFY
jgi:hypothetical protein